LVKRLAVRAISPPLTRPQFLWLLGMAAATLAPHLPYLPPWLAALAASLVVIQGVRAWREQPPPPRWLLAVLALGAIAGIVLTFRQILGKDPGVALLVVLLGLKLLEGRSQRDARAAVLLALFLQVALFLNSQSPAVGAWALACAGLALATLASLHQPGGAPAQLRLAGLLLAQGLPFMLVLFFLFPRVQGPLWGLPSDAYSAMTGLSDSMTPGSISRLIQSDAIALRARFAGEPPPRTQLYWRGPVLEEFDGRSWRAGRERILPAPAYAPAGPSYAYQLTLEPHDKTWLLALDFPAPALARTRYAADFRLLTLQPVKIRQRFDLVAWPNTPVGLAEGPEALRAALELPPMGNHRARELGRELRERRGTPAAIVEAAARHFREAGLVYTLNPPPLTGDTVDGFLFDTRRGFCEHFASAFTFVLRAAGVPARVVTGYQGGEINPVDQILEVRQSDAHAWTEAWLAGRGWVRLDPTVLAAPARAQGSLVDALAAGEPLPYMLRTNMEWLRSLRHRWDALNNTWNQWVLGYTPERQRDLLHGLGLGEMGWQRLATLLTATCGLLLAALIVWAMRGHRPRDPLERCWLDFCRRLARAGLPRLPWEGPLAYAERAAVAFPHHADALRSIARSYARQRYGATPGAAELKSLHGRIRRFRLT
jgi:protein-glutamine gamma-glutamyltransferase